MRKTTLLRIGMRVTRHPRICRAPYPNGNGPDKIAQDVQEANDRWDKLVGQMPLDPAAAQ